LIHNTLLGILFSSILCSCPNQRNLCSLTDSADKVIKHKKLYTAAGRRMVILIIIIIYNFGKHNI
jgi:hypothetical protein